jgi:hypothetical protein
MAINPPPDGCGGGPPGGQSSEGGLIAIPWSSNPPNIGLIIISALMMTVIYRYSRESAFGLGALNQAGRVREYRLTPKLA